MDSNKVISSFAFKFIERLMVKAIGLIISVLLARMLVPEIFGFIAIINVFINLAITFVQSGLSTSLVQNKKVDNEDYSTVFWVSLLISIVMIAIIYIVAPFISDYYGDEILTKPLRVFSFSLVFGALNSVQTAKMQREMQFRNMMFCNLFATVLSGVLGVISAYMGLGIWALIVYYFSSILLTTITMAWVGHWHPTFVFSTKQAKIHFDFGWKMLISSLMTSLYNDLNSLIIGKKFSTSDLAYYNRGQQFPEVLANTVDVSVQSVVLPLMAKKQDNINELKKILYRTITVSMFLVSPIMMGMVAVANTMIPLLLTEKWNSCIPLMQIFCIANVSLPLRTSCLSIIKAMGRSDVYMKLEAVRRLVMLIVLAITVLFFHSVTVIALGFAISAWIDAWIICSATKKLIQISWREQIFEIWKSIFACAVMSIVVYMMNYFETNKILLLFLQTVVGFLIYFGISILIKNKSNAYLINKIKGMSKEYKKKRKNHE